MGVSHSRNKQTMTSARIEQLEAGAAPKRVAVRTEVLLRLCNESHKTAQMRNSRGLHIERK
jgi:hypothetical protein